MKYSHLLVSAGDGFQALAQIPKSVDPQDCGSVFVDSTNG